MSEQYRRFLPLLRERARILDVGSGSGRDACYFQKKGYQVTALEPSKNLCREIRKVFSGKIVCSDIQSYQPNQRFDGIWACASFLHLYIFPGRMEFLQEKRRIDVIFLNLLNSWRKRYWQSMTEWSWNSCGIRKTSTGERVSGGWIWYLGFHPKYDKRQRWGCMAGVNAAPVMQDL